MRRDMAQDESGVERRRRSPWGALALVMLTGLALMRNGADITMGPPQPAAAAALHSRAGNASSPRPAPAAPAPPPRPPPVRPLLLAGDGSNQGGLSLHGCGLSPRGPGPGPPAAGPE